MKFQIAAGASALFIFSGLCAAAEERAFEIRLERPYREGQAFQVTAEETVRASQKIETPDGKSTQSSNFRRLRLDADVRVEKADAQGKPEALSLTVRALTQQSNADAGDAQAQDLLPAGTHLRATVNRDGDATFTDTAGKAIADDALVALKNLATPAAMRDSVLGSTVPRKVGESWPANTKDMPVDRLNPQAVDPADLAGEVTLKGVGSVAGVECLQLEVTLSTDKVNVGGPPPVEAKLTLVRTAALPVEVAKPPVSTSTKSTIHVVVEQKPLGRGVLRTTVDSETTRQATWAAK